jgi:hypothetical protein
MMLIVELKGLVQGRTWLVPSILLLLSIIDDLLLILLLILLSAC